MFCCEREILRNVSFYIRFYLIVSSLYLFSYILFAVLVAVVVILMMMILVIKTFSSHIDAFTRAVIQGGDNTDVATDYNPFYITDDPEGGHEAKSLIERQVSHMVKFLRFRTLSLTLSPLDSLQLFIFILYYAIRRNQRKTKSQPIFFLCIFTTFSSCLLIADGFFHCCMLLFQFYLIPSHIPTYSLSTLLTKSSNPI